MPSCPKIQTMAFAGLGILAILVVFAAILVPYIFYLITLQKAFQKISPAYRKMEPGLVWLVFIPFFGIVWNFFIVTYLADGLAAEFKNQGKTPSEARPGYGVGLAMCISIIATFIPILGGLASLAVLILWIIYWVRIHGYSNQLSGIGAHAQVLDGTATGATDDF